MMTEEKRDAREIPDPEVRVTAKFRRFSNEYKLEILRRADACTQPGEVAALLEAEGLYSSYLSRWRQAHGAGRLNGTEGQKRGPKPLTNRDLAEEHAALQRENARLRERLATAETIIDVQKKLSRLLGLEISTPENEETV
jgi:transposase-like protein